MAAAFHFWNDQLDALPSPPVLMPPPFHKEQTKLRKRLKPSGNSVGPPSSDRGPHRWVMFSVSSMDSVGQFAPSLRAGLAVTLKWLASSISAT